jgi:hypothetical protein
MNIFQLIFNIYTSNIKTEFLGMPSYGSLPYPKLGGITILERSPRLIFGMPISHPYITSLLIK